MHKSCQFQIKNGKVTPPIKNVENLITYNQQYSLLEDGFSLIVETKISATITDTETQMLNHKTLIVLSNFNHKPYEIDEAVKSLMWNLRHNIFDKIKSELGIYNEDYLLIYFPNDEQFSCNLNKDLTFENYDFKPSFNHHLLADISY